MKLSANLRFALTGWIAGLAATLLLSVLWPHMMPGIINVQHYYGAGPGIVAIVAVILLLASPAAAVGGFVGSRVPKEGGRMEQQIAAAIAGIVLAMPFACYGLWFFTGW